MKIDKNGKYVFDDRYFMYDLDDVVDSFHYLYNEINKYAYKSRPNQNGRTYYNPFGSFDQSAYSRFFNESFFDKQFNERFGYYDKHNYGRNYQYTDSGKTRFSEPKKPLTPDEIKLSKLEEVYKRYKDQLHREQSEGKDTTHTQNEMSVVQRKINKIKNKINKK